MNEKLILGTAAMLFSINTAIPVIASQIEQAQNDAEIVVINQREVLAQELHDHGDEYTREFLIHFHEASQKFQQAYLQGIKDQRDGEVHSYSDRVEQAAYQKGIDEGKLRRTGESGQVQSAHNRNPQNQVVDQKKYPQAQLKANQAQFINRIAKNAQKIGQQYDLYPSVIIAQAALESNWGTSELSLAPHHNLFGVKGEFAGHGVIKSTAEFIDSHEEKVQAKFRSYQNDWLSLKDYAETLQQPIYQKVHRSSGKSYRDATQALVGCYATDPQYNKKLNQIIDSYQLTKYDEAYKEGNEKAAISEPKTVTSIPKIHRQKDDSSPSSCHHSVSPVIPAVGGAASAGLLTVIKKLLVS